MLALQINSITQPAGSMQKRTAEAIQLRRMHIKSLERVECVCPPEIGGQTFLWFEIEDTIRGVPVCLARATYL